MELVSEHWGRPQSMRSLAVRRRDKDASEANEGVIVI